ncbi:hypothetical protein Mlute_01777 [Meiothermus luteus]|jgi:hypothetical protein|uniref:Uncharacterized protein n=2 Tax=Thermaceae TaxID=188786 RepID=A0A399EVR8_9DEIN|nr:MULTISPECIES: hypothetical protein [Thermaceae]RIH84792.1 hypothetical protein Mlute_01777 [Meiothermus luteus]RIH88654.1 hypothetical protein Mterra_00958 [Calidithermus terrae]RMH53816.1 MAG: hypothetical protein D6684_11280 [Deinococcota bacterium]GIW32638.1 MAG: hypothetical protein KatS3mg071_2812 [Meiothermus sp.]
MTAPGPRPAPQWALALLALPFFLQLLGFGGALGGGLCGALFRGRDLPLDQQPAGFWYALLFMGLLSFQLLYAVFTGLLLLLDAADRPGAGAPPARSYRGGAWLALLLVIAFLLTRTVGLPVPSAQGVIWGEAAGANPLGLVMVGMTLAGGLWLWRIGRWRGEG